MNDKPNLESITVYTPGTHAGKRYTPGADGHAIDVTPAEAKWLRDMGADKPPETPAIAAPARTEGAERAAPARAQIPTGAGVDTSKTVPPLIR